MGQSTEIHVIRKYLKSEHDIYLSPESALRLWNCLKQARERKPVDTWQLQVYVAPNTNPHHPDGGFFPNKTGSLEEIEAFRKMCGYSPLDKVVKLHNYAEEALSLFSKSFAKQ